MDVLGAAFVHLVRDPNRQHAHTTVHRGRAEYRVSGELDELVVEVHPDPYAQPAAVTAAMRLRSEAPTARARARSIAAETVPPNEAERKEARLKAATELADRLESELTAAEIVLASPPDVAIHRLSAAQVASTFATN